MTAVHAWADLVRAIEVMVVGYIASHSYWFHTCKQSWDLS